MFGAYRFPTLHWEKVCGCFLGNRPPFFFLFAFSFAPVLSPLHFLSLEKEKRKAEKNKLAPSSPFSFPVYIPFFAAIGKENKSSSPSSDLYLGSKRRYFSVWGSEGGECVLCGHKEKKCFQDKRRQVHTYKKQKNPDRFLAKAKHCLRCVKVYLGTKTRNRKYAIQRPGYFAKTRMIFLRLVLSVYVWEGVVSESHPIPLSDHLIMPLTEGYMA